MRRRLGATGEGVKVFAVEPQDLARLADAGDAADADGPGCNVGVEGADRNGEVLGCLLSGVVRAAEVGE
jgi:hypothetical protein